MLYSLMKTRVIVLGLFAFCACCGQSATFAFQLNPVPSDKPPIMAGVANCAESEIGFFGNWMYTTTACPNVPPVSGYGQSNVQLTGLPCCNGTVCSCEVQPILSQSSKTPRRYQAALLTEAIAIVDSGLQKHNLFKSTYNQARGSTRVDWICSLEGYRKNWQRYLKFGTLGKTPDEINAMPDAAQRVANFNSDYDYQKTATSDGSMTIADEDAAVPWVKTGPRQFGGSVWQRLVADTQLNASHPNTVSVSNGWAETFSTYIKVELSGEVVVYFRHVQVRKGSSSFRTAFQIQQSDLPAGATVSDGQLTYQRDYVHVLKYAPFATDAQPLLARSYDNL